LLELFPQEHQALEAPPSSNGGQRRNDDEKDEEDDVDDQILGFMEEIIQISLFLGLFCTSSPQFLVLVERGVLWTKRENERLYLCPPRRPTVDCSAAVRSSELLPKIGCCLVG